MDNRYVIGAQVIAARYEVGSDLARWEKGALLITAMASVATLLEVTYKWWKRGQR